jgi:hypothetical protein
MFDLYDGKKGQSVELLKKSERVEELGQLIELLKCCPDRPHVHDILVSDALMPASPCKCLPGLIRSSKSK